MSPLLRASSTDKINPTITVDVKPHEKVSIFTQFWSFECEESVEEKAGAIFFRFLDEKNAVVSSPERMHRTDTGETFWYLNAASSETTRFDIVIPTSAVKLSMHIRGWRHKNFKSEITKVEFHNRTTRATHVEPKFHPLLLHEVPTEEACMRLEIECMLAEETRQKNMFDGKTIAVPSASDLRNSEQYSTSVGYVDRRGVQGIKPRHLVICTSYPEDQNVHLSAFLHSRIKSYLAYDIEVDVLSFARGSKPRIWRFDGVDVLGGYVNELVALLALGTYESVSIHFLHPHMWSAIKPFFARHKFHLFFHGHGARSWSRVFNPDGGLEAARREKSQSDLYKDLWNAVLRERTFPASFIFVSNWMLKCAEDDMQITFPRNRTHVIHNPIDTALFAYTQKQASDSTKILMIRNFDKYQYGTDIGIRCIEELMSRPIWEKLKITIFGTGSNLDHLRRVIGGANNVEITEKYLSHVEISALHKQNGLMLIPTRWDSQGVSRDEAMSSGLVPVTNAVCAIPEFVDDSCAILAPAENHITLADGIEMLATNPAKFLAMSAEAAKRVKTQCDKRKTIFEEKKVLGL